VDVEELRNALEQLLAEVGDRAAELGLRLESCRDELDAATLAELLAEADALRQRLEALRARLPAAPDPGPPAADAP
jgi:hypothetical protein